jgi:hypothetical protein
MMPTIENSITGNYRMGKRLTCTDKWKKKFIRGLPSAYKLLWFFVCDECNVAGIWEVDMEIACVKTGEALDEGEALRVFGDRVRVIDDGKKWWVVDFIDFQYGGLKERSNTYRSVCELLRRYGLPPFAPPPADSGRGLEGAWKEVAAGATEEVTIYTLNNNTGNKGNTGVDLKKENEGALEGDGRGFEGAYASRGTAEVELPWKDEEFGNKWAVWKEYKWQQHQWRYSYQAERHAVEQLWKLANGDVLEGIRLIEVAIGRGWKNFFKTNDNAAIAGNTNGAAKAAGAAKGTGRGASLKDIEGLKRGGKAGGDERGEFAMFEVVK